MGIKPVFLGKLDNIDRDYGLTCGADDVFFVSPSKSKYDLDIVRVIHIDREKIPPYFQVYAVDFPFRVFLYEESISDIGIYDMITGEVNLFSTIYPSHYFGSELSVSTNRAVFAASSLYFFIFREDGKLMNYCHQNGCSMDEFQPPIPGEFSWASPGSFPSSISAAGNSFVIGGHPVNCIYKYQFDGRLELSIDGFYTSITHFRFKDEWLQRVRLDNKGRIWASTSERLYLFSATGEPIMCWPNTDLIIEGKPVDLQGWFGIDRNGLLWIYGHAGQESVPYGAFELV